MPTLKISPDLGWADRGDMLDPSSNPRVAQWDLSGLSQVPDTPAYAKTRDTLVFEHSSVKYKLDPSEIRSLGGSVVHYWQVDSGPIQSFVLDLSAPRPKRTEEVSVTTPRILS